MCQVRGRLFDRAGARGDVEAEAPVVGELSFPIAVTG